MNSAEQIEHLRAQLAVCRHKLDAVQPVVAVAVEHPDSCKCGCGACGNLALEVYTYQQRKPESQRCGTCEHMSGLVDNVGCKQCPKTGHGVQPHEPACDDYQPRKKGDANDGTAQLSVQVDMIPPTSADSAGVGKRSWGTCVACGRNVGAGCRTDVVGDGDPEDCQCDDPSLGVTSAEAGAVEAGPEPATETPWYANTFPDVPPAITAGLHSVCPEVATTADAAAIVHRVNNWAKLIAQHDAALAKVKRLKAELDEVRRGYDAAVNERLRAKKRAAVAICDRRIAERRADDYRTAAMRLRGAHKASSKRHRVYRAEDLVRVAEMAAMVVEMRQRAEKAEAELAELRKRQAEMPVWMVAIQEWQEAATVYETCGGERLCEQLKSAKYRMLDALRVVDATTPNPGAVVQAQPVDRESLGDGDPEDCQCDDPSLGVTSAKAGAVEAGPEYPERLGGSWCPVAERDAALAEVERLKEMRDRAQEMTSGPGAVVQATSEGDAEVLRQLQRKPSRTSGTAFEIAIDRATITHGSADAPLCEKCGQNERWCCYECYRRYEPPQPCDNGSAEAIAIAPEGAVEAVRAWQEVYDQAGTPEHAYHSLRSQMLNALAPATVLPVAPVVGLLRIAKAKSNEHEDGEHCPCHGVCEWCEFWRNLPDEWKALSR